jgi:hypothetical protein
MIKRILSQSQVSLILALGCLVLASCRSDREPVQPAESRFLRRDYYIVGGIEKQGVDPLAVRALDEIIYFAPLTPDAQGHVVVDEKFVSGLAILKSAKAPHAKLCLGAGDLGKIQTNAAAIQVFVDELKAICAKHGFTAVDVDWEGEMNAKTVYGPTMRPVIEQLQKAGLRVYVSMTGWSYNAAQAGSIADIVDGVHVQLYYQRGGPQPLSEIRDRVVPQFTAAGLAKEKFFAGFPLYAMSERTPELHYAGLLKAGANPDTNEFRHPNGQVFHYNGRPLMKAKVEYAREAGLGGVFTWYLCYDMPYASELSMLRLIDAAAGKVQPKQKEK